MTDDLILLESLEVPLSQPPNSPSFLEKIKTVYLSEENINLSIIMALLAIAVSNLLPDPSDAIYFIGQKYLREHRNEISKLKSIGISIGSFYLPEAAWYTFLALLALKIPGAMNKIRTLSVLIGMGAIAGIIGGWALSGRD